MRKALISALVIAGGFVGGCSTTNVPNAGIHAVSGEASPVATAVHSINAIGDVAGPGTGGGGGPCKGEACEGGGDGTGTGKTVRNVQ
jgi:hypothetical protein